MDHTYWINDCAFLPAQPDAQVPESAMLLAWYLHAPAALRQVQLLACTIPTTILHDDASGIQESADEESILYVISCN